MGKLHTAGVSLRFTDRERRYVAPCILQGSELVRDDFVGIVRDLSHRRNLENVTERVAKGLYVAGEEFRNSGFAHLTLWGRIS